MQPDKYGNKPGSKQQPPGHSQDPNPMRPARVGQGLPGNPEREEEEEEESGNRREQDDEGTGIQPDRGSPSGSSQKDTDRSNR